MARSATAAPTCAATPTFPFPPSAGEASADSRLEAAAITFEEDGSEADEELAEAIFDAVSPDEQIDLFKSFIDDSLPIIEDFIDAIADLNPPAEVSEPHEAAVSAGETLVEAFSDLQDGIDDADTPAEAQSLLDEDNVTAASEQFTTSCLALQAIADENDIEVDLQCGGE